MGIGSCGDIAGMLNQSCLQLFGPTGRECLSCREHTCVACDVLHAFLFQTLSVDMSQRVCLHIVDSV